MDWSRRSLLEAIVALGVLPPVPAPAAVEGGGAAGAVAVASSNGVEAVRLARRLMTEERADPLEAAIAGVELLELDPDDTSVGLGGLPNEDGVVQLDASCMHGPTRRAGAVAALERVATAARVAKAVMEHTDHVMLVGEGATRFALEMGFEERELLTPESRRDWVRWRSRLAPDDNWLDAEEDGGVPSTRGTINLCAVDAGGDMASVTTTSGLSWKIPGRASDSPIPGAGQYCDNRVGAAGSTGRGEANMKACGAFLVVEGLRAGLPPTDACLAALQRAVEMSEPRLLDERGRPRFFLEYYALTRTGEHGAATMYEPREAEREYGYGYYAVADGDGDRLEPIAHLYAVDERPGRMIM